LAGIRKRAWVWYSHRRTNEMEVAIQRRLVMIDQGFDTMHGASGDDWISSPSMRTICARLVCGVVGQHCVLGFSATGIRRPTAM